MDNARLRPSLLHLQPLLQSVILLLFITVLLPLQVAASELTAQEERGRRIYFTGESPSGRPIVAYFGKDLLEVPGESATCASCHGFDGLGRSESGVIPSNITWQHLMKSYGHIHPNGVKHSAFNEQSLTTYLQDGILPGGVQGDPVMPVYDISSEDLLDLLAFNRRLGSYLDSGLSDRSIRIGMAVPIRGPAAETGGDMLAAVRAWFDQVNGGGGIYGRSLELVPVTSDFSPDVPSGLRTSLEKLELFALLNSINPGREQELESLAETMQLPLITPFTSVQSLSPVFRRYVFHLHADLRQQVQVLAKSATGHPLPVDPRIVIIFPDKSGIEAAVSDAEAAYRAKGWQRIVRMGYAHGAFDARGTVSRLNRERADAVMFLGDESESDAFFKESGALQTAPFLYLAGGLTGKSVFQIPPVFRGRVWLVFPSLPDDRKGWGVTEFNRLALQQKPGDRYQAAQLTAYASARVLVEALRRAGRELSRERLVECLEGLFEFETGLTRPVSFGKNRRTGTLGAHIVTLEALENGTLGRIVPQGWVDLK